MKQKTQFLSFCFISLIVIICGCAKEPDNVVVSSDGVKISFDVQGEGEPALVFVHGWSNNRSIWDEQVAHFSEKYKVITVDLPGFGESGNNRQMWTMSLFGQDVAAVVNKLGLKQVVLVGFSMGAPVVIEAAKSVPDQIVGLVLVDHLHDIEMKRPPELVRIMDSFYMDLVTDPTIEKMSPAFFKRNVEASFERILAMLSGAPRVGWRESLIDALRWQNKDAIKSLIMIHALIISINSDRTPTNVEGFLRYVPSFKVKIIPDVGHVVMWDAPDEFNRLLEESIREFVVEPE